jgi:hypothetical protein
VVEGVDNDKEVVKMEGTSMIFFLLINCEMMSDECDEKATSSVQNKIYERICA